MTTENIDFQRWMPFQFYGSGKADGWETQSVAEGQKIKVGTIQLHFSSVFASVEDLVMYISSCRGSSFNHKILSQALLSIQDLTVMYSDDFYLSASDQLVFTASMKSNINAWGLDVYGWAVRG